VGRSLGFTEPVRRALGRLEASPEEFAQEITEVRAHLEGSASVTAQPGGTDAPPLFVLATGTGLQTAAALGLPAVIGGPILDADELPELMARYRRDFRPHRGSAPEVIASVDALVADTDQEARDLALPEVWAMARSRTTGVFEQLEPVERIRREDWSEKETRRVEKGVAAAVAGAVDTVRRRIEQIVERSGAAEILSSGSTYDREALADSDRRLAELLRCPRQDGPWSVPGTIRRLSGLLSLRAELLIMVRGREAAPDDGHGPRQQPDEGGQSHREGSEAEGRHRQEERQDKGDHDQPGGYCDHDQGPGDRGVEHAEAAEEERQHEGDHSHRQGSVAYVPQRQEERPVKGDHDQPGGYGDHDQGPGDRGVEHAEAAEEERQHEGDPDALRRLDDIDVRRRPVAPSWCR